ncbi:bifunctional diguanylate cyclase/phosphodiesterase [Microbacterium terricola]|uniref:Diguanylate cyclase n=1 Tax=Microbacterium terricola TaxID=344163 RepID=A0ABM8DXE6_9MICO|nr:sensor domain-containing diguanylate cyclase [Microbacterium terricola]UYK38962.1 diguanylate cyclase [Microbacterium terricola]BDV30338.1 hypothetical protein Microterr_09980 [Microbacterium terricola]
MDPAELAIDPDEVRRLADCAKEPIRTPGMIQRHGTLLAVDTATQVIAVVSEDAREWLGRPFADIGNPALADAVRTGTAVDPVRVSWGGAPADAIVHATGGLTMVELETVPTGAEYARTAVVSALGRLSAIGTIPELRASAAAEIRRIVGFDRVMIYHFHEDGHGEVVADDRDDELEPFLGLHFPSSDIPPQARELYISKIGRAIASTQAAGIPLLSVSGDPRAVDLSHAELRSVSPYHLQYMRNMGQASTFSLSLVEDGRLVGMITCAHRTERRLPVLLRRSLEVLAAQITMQLTHMREVARLEHVIAARERRTALLAPLYASDDIHTTLLGGSETVLGLIPADGVLVRIGGTSHALGRTPPLDGVTRALAVLEGAPLASECLEADRPDLASVLPEVAGLLVVPLNGTDDVLMFFRGEVSREISWLGDPGQTNRPDRLSPRTSFSSWKQTVRGRSEPWGTVVQEAGELAHELEVALKRRAEAQLARLAMRDALTGLHNRRYLVERLRAAEEHRLALLFIDLDDFKSVNDVHGHDTGDAVIREVAHRLVAHSRETDAVVRLGGDEFVVLLDVAAGDDVHGIAERMVEAIAAPIVTGRASLTVTASCGVVMTESGAPGPDLIEAADAAMYRAKRAGRNRVSA